VGRKKRKKGGKKETHDNRQDEINRRRGCRIEPREYQELGHDMHGFSLRSPTTKEVK